MENQKVTFVRPDKTKETLTDHPVGIHWHPDTEFYIRRVNSEPSPVDQGLKFERFLDPSRTTDFPDIPGIV